MAPQLSTVSSEHADPTRQRLGLPRLRQALTVAALAATVALAGIVTRGDAQQITAAPNADPATGHAQVIAQAVLDLPEGNLAWSVTTIVAEEQPAGLPTDGVPGFVLGAEGAAVVRTAAGSRTILASGEAQAVRPDTDLTVQAVGSDPASLALLTLGRAGGDDLGAAIAANEAFPSPGGTRYIELIGDVLAEGESAALAAGTAPTLVLVTEGSLVLAVADDEPQAVAAGETALVSGDLVVTDTAEDPAHFVAAVFGAEVDAESADAGGATPTPRPSSSPRPSPSPQSSPRPSASPTPSASPSPSPSSDTSKDPSSSPSASPTSDGEGPDDDPDGDGLVNEREDALHTDRHDPDTDYDLLTDGDEYHTYLTNPTVRDTEQDGLYDGDEVIRVGTSPITKDTDADGLEDGPEANEFLTNPLDDDTDHDDYHDYDEVLGGTNPRVADTDGDDIADGQEVIQYFTNPLVYDTDGDGYGDGDEVYYYDTNPNDPDTDHDGLNEAEELFLGTKPKNPDTDGDGYSDGAEIYTHRTWPLDPESHP